MESPVFSVVTPAYKSAGLIEDAIESVLAQSFSDFEHFVVDDGSDDATREIIRNFARLDSRVRPVFLESNGGPANARNVAISQAKGRFIAFLDDDDIWYPSKLSRQLEVFRSGSPFVYSAYDLMSEKGEKIGFRSVPISASYNDLLSHNVIGTLTAAYDTAYFGKILMPDIRKRQDLGLWLRLLRDNGSATGIQEPLGCYRVRRGSISSNKLDAAKYTWRLYREVELLPLSKSSYFFGRYAALGLFRTISERMRIRRERQRTKVGAER